jgi:DNA-binding GntR family transcriptional regulator
VITVPSASEEPVLGHEADEGGVPVFAHSLAAEGGPDREGPEPARDEAVAGRRAAEASRPAADVLADRIAAALVHHEPGWRLPRHTALARRYNVSTAEIDAALEELAARHLIRRLADGQLYRVSPAEYLIPIEGVPGLSSRADPMGGQIVCRSRQASLRQVPEDIGWALRVPSADAVGVIRTQWTAGGEPAAFITTYLVRDIAGPFLDAPGSQGSDPPVGLTLLPVTSDAAESGESGQIVLVGEPRALHIEMQPPPPSVARSLRLAAGQPAALVTVRFDHPEQHRPVALTVAVFRPDLFRIVVQAGSGPWAEGPLLESTVLEGPLPDGPVPDGAVPDGPVPDGPVPDGAVPDGPVPDRAESSFSEVWTHAVEDWES